VGQDGEDVVRWNGEEGIVERRHGDSLVGNIVCLRLER
jgi:hypothetical protein